LLVDTSLSQRNVLGEERDASYAFLDQVLRPDKDLTFVIHFDHDTELLQDLTSSRRDLRKALDALRLADGPQLRQAGQGGGGGGYPGGNRGNRGGGRQQAGTTLYDAIFLASDELMRKQKGRKALILLTDGVDEGSKETLYDCIKAAQRNDTLVYSILFADRDAYGSQPAIRLGGIGMGGRGMGRGGGMPQQTQHPDGKKILQQISRETGGGFFEVSKKDPIDDIYRRIQEELRNQYSIGYVSDQGASSTGFRRILLTTRDKAMTVQAPEGYYPAGQ
jgi:VWFA-related protein